MTVVYDNKRNEENPVMVGSGYNSEGLELVSEQSQQNRQPRISPWIIRIPINKKTLLFNMCSISVK